ncbi:Proline iminopeptidase [Elizabethkingia miricola]|nr:Proline iminopeptidase [Elizabethkingia miricola]
MKKLISLLFLLHIIVLHAQTIYSKSYGDSNNPVIIFVHGGPSGNATLFEGTVAQDLANKGFYVIAYDRRGEGRSVDSNATFTFQESFQDLNDLYNKYNLKKANILAHSFGGIVATLYAAQFPHKVSSLILAGGLFSQQETYNHILKSAKEYYTNKQDIEKLTLIQNVEQLSKNSAEYRKSCYELASDLNYFKMPNPTRESIKLRSQYENSPFYKDNIRNINSPSIFYKNEKQNNIDTKSVLKKIKKQHVKLFAVYGKDDGIFNTKQLKDIQNIVGKDNFQLIDNCSHYLFVDQEKIFLDFIDRSFRVTKTIHYK